MKILMFEPGFFAWWALLLMLLAVVSPVVPRYRRRSGDE